MMEDNPQDPDDLVTIRFYIRQDDRGWWVRAIAIECSELPPLIRGPLPSQTEAEGMIQDWMKNIEATFPRSTCAWFSEN